MQKHIIFVAPVPMTLDFFLRLQIMELKKKYKVTLVSNFKGAKRLEIEGVDTIHVPMARNINIWSDLYSMFCLFRIYRRLRPLSVHSIGPKAGLLSSLSGKLAGIRNRFHCFTGQVWVDYSGIKRYLFIFIDKIIARTCSRIIIDSPTQKKFLMKEGVVNNQAVVFGEGSISGVNLDRFNNSASSQSELRMRLGIPKNKFIYLFLGRVTEDKGVQELLGAFKLLNKNISDEALLLVVGPSESILFDDDYFNLPNVLRIPFTSEPELYFSASNVLCLPSYREGFGQVVIEAAACGLPAIVSNIYGLTDAVIDGQTGFLVEKKNIEALAGKMLHVFNNGQLLEVVGRNARERTVADFSSERIVDCYVHFYDEVVQ